MTQGKIVERVVVGRLALIEVLLRDIRALPLGTLEIYTADARNVAASESYLRRALEALMDIGRHILAKGFGMGVTEYKQVATELEGAGVLQPGDAAMLRTLAGYRNRMVHVYAEVTPPELYEICTRRLGDIERIAGELRDWTRRASSS